VIVEVDKKLDYGQVVSELETVLEANADREQMRKIIRVASDSDMKKIEENRKDAREVFNVCAQKISEKKLSMKLIDAEYSFDRSRLIFYFTSEGRIDFRDLVKELADRFKARIELRQIGVRDEARMLGGLGCCGRGLCCASFLQDFEPVTIKMAKEQNLPLNPNKISGVCGRLMCCLSYEYETYKELLKDLPKEGDLISTKEGKGKVVGINAIKKSVTIELEEGRRMEIPYGPGHSCVRVSHNNGR
jgi:cell fate regulator YaaT (PSP1 superfamily)